MTAFGGGVEPAQGPSPGLPQLQSCNKPATAAAATDAAKREPSPWRPAAGQGFGQGLGMVPDPHRSPPCTQAPSGMLLQISQHLVGFRCSPSAYVLWLIAPAGAQAPGVGLAGYETQNSLLRELEAERARHAAWQQKQVLPAPPVQDPLL